MATPRACSRTSRRFRCHRCRSTSVYFSECASCCSDADERSMMKEQIAQRLRDLAATAVTAAERVGPDAEAAATMMRDALKGGGTLFFCGHGGSPPDAQHLATVYVVHYMKNRLALPATALTTDTSLITAAGNDFGFDEIFARQVEALVSARDVLVIHSTSGNSPNVVK